MHFSSLALGLVYCGFEAGVKANSLRAKQSNTRKLHASYYPIYGNTYDEGYCAHGTPLNGIPSFETMEKCCDASFKNQQSGKCIGNADSAPVAMTSSGSGGTGSSSGTPGAVEYACASGPTPLEFHPTRAFQVEKDQCVPAIDTAAFSYNMWVGDNFTGNTIYFLDQKNGIIYSHDTSSTDAPTKVFDMSNASQVPVGLDLSWSYGSAAMVFKVKAMTQGPNANSVIVVFNSATLPPGWTEADGKLPAPGAFSEWVCGSEGGSASTFIDDIYRVGTVPECFQNGAGLETLTTYDVFYKFTAVNGALTNPEPFFTAEVHVTPGHLGGGIATLPDGNILWSPGDCTIFGVEGRYAPQLDNEWCGKIHKIYTNRSGSYTMVAKGVRNPQQMRIYDSSTGTSMLSRRKLAGTAWYPIWGNTWDQGYCTNEGTAVNGVPKYSTEDECVKTWFNYPSYQSLSQTSSSATYNLAFMEIGGVTAEEVNGVSLDELLNTDTMTNFGWGRNIEDGKAREGMFYVNPGNGGILGIEPSCNSGAPTYEPGFTQPWIQFGRTATDAFYAISSIAIPSHGIETVKLLWSEFNTGHVMGTEQALQVDGYSGPAQSYKYKIYNATGVELPGALNDLVQEELGDVGYYRGDPRLFHYPSGEPGAFIERTGCFYKLTEIAIP